MGKSPFGRSQKSSQMAGDKKHPENSALYLHFQTHAKGESSDYLTWNTSSVSKGWESWGCSVCRRAWGEPVAAFQYLEGVYKKAEVLFTRAWSNWTRGNGFTLKKGRFRLGIRKKFFIMRMVRHWHRLSREAEAVPSLAVFKARLDRALSNLVQWKLSLPMAGGVELNDF